MTKTGQHQRRVSTIRRLQTRGTLAIVGAVFITAAIGTPAAQARTCNGSTSTEPSPGCTPLHFFTGATDGGDPVGGVTINTNPGIYDGALFGTTNGGGVNAGTVYELSPPTKKGAAWGYTQLYAFGTEAGLGLPDGSNPQAPLAIDKNGVIYGTTPGNCGEVFTLTPPAAAGGTWAYNVIHTFLGGANDGCNPWWAGVSLGKNGVLYGTTQWGGSATANNGLGWGTVYELAPPASPGGAWTESIVHAFTGGSDGAYPQANVLFNAANGTLYATAYSGGIAACGGVVSGIVGCGTVIELTPRAGKPWKLSVLHTFTGGADGGLSSSALIMKAGVLYGTTSEEDSFYDNGGDCTWGCGTVFAIAPPTVAGGAWTETVLYHFVAPYPAPYTTCPTVQCDASAPVGGVVFGSNGSLYGTTAYGGPFGTGTIFELTPPASPGATWTESVIYDIAFDAGTGGYTSFPTSPFAGLTLGKGGTLYGTETSDAGMVFQLKP